MPNIEIYNLPDAGTLSDSDFLHLAQSSSDKRISIGDLSDSFGEVDIYALTEQTSPTGANFFAISDSSGDISNNRKVTLDNLSDLFQSSSYYPSGTELDLDDVFVYREDSSANLTVVTMQDVRDKTLDGNAGFTPLGERAATADKLFIYDASETEAKSITTPWLRQSMIETTNLNSLTLLAVDDAFPIWNKTNTEAKKITYGDLEAQIEASISPSDYAKLAGANTFTASNTFTDSSGVTTDKISVESSNTLSINHTTVSVGSLLTAINIDATYLEGAFLGDRGNSSYYINSETQTLYSSYRDSDDVVDAKIFRIKTDGLLPNDNDTTFLGDQSKAWGEIHGDKLYIQTAYTANTVANNISLRGSSSYSYLYLLEYEDGVRGNQYKINVDWIRKAGYGYDSDIGTYAYGSSMLASASALGPTYASGDSQSTDPKNVVGLDQMCRSQTRYSGKYLGAISGYNTSGTADTFYAYLYAQSFNMGDAMQQVVGNIVIKDGTSTSYRTYGYNWEAQIDFNALFNQYFSASSSGIYKAVSVQTTPMRGQGTGSYDASYWSFTAYQSKMDFGFTGSTLNYASGICFTATFINLNNSE